MSMNFYSSLYCAMPGLNAVYETKSRALLSAGLCVTVQVVCPWSQPRAAEQEETLSCYSFRTAAFIHLRKYCQVSDIHSVSPMGRYGTFLTDRAHLWKMIMTTSLERERGVSKKNVSLVLLGAVNVTAHRKEMFLGPGLINQSGSLRWRHFISVSETCRVASGLQERLRNGFPGKEQTGDITRESLVFLDAALGQS